MPKTKPQSQVTCIFFLMKLFRQPNRTGIMRLPTILEGGEEDEACSKP